MADVGNYDVRYMSVSTADGILPQPVVYSVDGACAPGGRLLALICLGCGLTPILPVRSRLTHALRAIAGAGIKRFYNHTGSWDEWVEIRVAVVRTCTVLRACPLSVIRGMSSLGDFNSSTRLYFHTHIQKQTERAAGQAVRLLERQRRLHAPCLGPRSPGQGHHPHGHQFRGADSGGTGGQ